MRMRSFALPFAAAFFLVSIGLSAVPATAQTAHFICGADANGKPVNCVTTAGVPDPATQQSDPPPPRKRASHTRTYYQKPYNQQPYYQQPTYQQPNYQQTYQAPAYYPPQPTQSSCCCPTVRRGFSFNFSTSCGYRNNTVQYQQPAYPSYSTYPQYQQPYPQYQYQQPYQAPAYYPPQPYSPYPQYTSYQPGYTPQVSVGIGVGARVKYRSNGRNCWKTKTGRLICR